MTKEKFENINYVKKILPENLKSFSVLIVDVVDNHIGWIDVEQKINALVICSAIAIDTFNRKFESKYNLSQFGSYLKIRLRGAILDEFKNEIQKREEGRLTKAGKFTEITIIDDLDYSKYEYYSEGYENYDSEPDVENDSEEYWRFEDDIEDDVDKEGRAIYFGYGLSAGWYEFGADSLYVSGFDDEYTRMADEWLGSPDEGDINELLPEREREILRHLEAGGHMIELCEHWGISRARGSQLQKQAQQRRLGFYDRYTAGEKFSVLKAESQKAQEIAARKELSLNKKAAQSD